MHNPQRMVPPKLFSAFAIFSAIWLQKVVGTGHPGSMCSADFAIDIYKRNKPNSNKWTFFTKMSNLCQRFFYKEWLLGSLAKAEGDELFSSRFVHVRSTLQYRQFEVNNVGIHRWRHSFWGFQQNCFCLNTCLICYKGSYELKSSPTVLQIFTLMPSSHYTTLALISSPRRV